MTQLDDLNAKIATLGTALDNVGTALGTLATDSAKSFADLKAAIASGSPTDLTAALAGMDTQIGKLTTISANLQTLDTEALAADPAAATTPPPPAAS